MQPDEEARKIREGCNFFNKGEFYEAHESWEDVWNELDDPERRWVQGAIQVATGLHKLTRMRPDVCVTLLRKALGKLHDAPPAWRGLDLEGARRGAERILSDLENGGRPDARSVTLKICP
jgi:predicted metal-dependent hydrolase